MEDESLSMLSWYDGEENLFLQLVDTVQKLLLGDIPRAGRWDIDQSIHWIGECWRSAVWSFLSSDVHKGGGSVGIWEGLIRNILSVIACTSMMCLDLTLWALTDWVLENSRGKDHYPYPKLKT